MPPPLPDELVEEVLLRFPPENPAGLVCTRWCRLVSGSGFRRRFREFHRRPPMLGMLCNIYSDYEIHTGRFIPTTAFCTPRTDFPDMLVLDARHGRVLCEEGHSFLAVWDPITDEVREFPFPQEKQFPWTAAVLCSAVGACGHLDCHDGPFLVVFVCPNKYGNGVIYTYSSDAAAWSEPAICAQQPYLVNSSMGSALVGKALYFGNHMGSTALKYDLELHQASLIRLPSSLSWQSLVRSQLTTTEDGVLGLAARYDSKLYMWSRKDTHELDTRWERRVSIELKTLFPVDVVSSKVYVIGSVDGLDIIFMSVDDVVYTIDLKSYKAKKVYEGTIDTAFPYMSFYTPALKGTCTGEGPSLGHSSA